MVLCLGICNFSCVYALNYYVSVTFMFSLRAVVLGFTNNWSLNSQELGRSHKTLFLKVLLTMLCSSFMFVLAGWKAQVNNFM